MRTKRASKQKAAKLTYPQTYALRRLKTDEWITAWDIHATSATLIALERMGLVERKKVVEYITGYDNTDYGWRLKASAADSVGRASSQGAALIPKTHSPSAPSDSVKQERG